MLFRSSWLQGGDSGPAVVPGNIHDSLLLKAVRKSDPHLQMPPNGSLAAEQLTAIEDWISAGAPAPDGRLSGPQDNPADPVAGRSHWAWQTLTAPAIPQVTRHDWPRSPIDAFILAELEARGLQPAEDAAPEIVLRRIAYQLTGLPPAPELVQRLQTEQLQTVLP